MSKNPTPTRRTALAALATLPAMAANAQPTPSVAAMDDAGTVITVMQFSARTETSRAELKKRMGEMRDYLRTQPGMVENALFENRNPTVKPHYVGVSRWKSFKDWENLWLKQETKLLVRQIGEVGELVPGTFSAVR